MVNTVYHPSQQPTGDAEMPATKKKKTTAKKATSKRTRKAADKTIEQLIEEFRAMDLEPGLLGAIATTTPDKLSASDVRKLVRTSARLKQRIESGEETRAKEREATEVRKEIHELLGVDPAVVRRRR
jgi:hypothetical protein